MTVKDKMMVYIYKKSCQLESEEENIRLQTRLLPLDSLEHFELMNAKMRISAWKEFINDIYKIVLNCK